LAKVAVLSVLHMSPLYLFSVVLASETFFLFLQWNVLKIKHGKLWLLANILPNLSLLLLVLLSRSLLSLYAASVLAAAALVVEFIILEREHRLNKMADELRISNDRGDKSVGSEAGSTLVVKRREEDLGMQQGSLQAINEFVLNDDMIEVKVRHSDSRNNFFSIQEDAEVEA
jgi:hypothetical protein